MTTTSAASLAMQPTVHCAVAGCDDCGWYYDSGLLWYTKPVRHRAAAAARRHVRETGHDRIRVEYSQSYTVGKPL